jgi:hypothetical protein
MSEEILRGLVYGLLVLQVLIVAVLVWHRRTPNHNTAEEFARASALLQPNERLVFNTSYRCWAVIDQHQDIGLVYQVSPRLAILQRRMKVAAVQEAQRNGHVPMVVKTRYGTSVVREAEVRYC